MLKSFKYTKVNGEVSYRLVYPIGVNDDKLMAIDLSDYDPNEQVLAEEKLNALRKEYINKLYEEGFRANFRQFFFEKME